MKFHSWMGLFFQVNTANNIPIINYTFCKNKSKSFTEIV